MPEFQTRSILLYLIFCSIHYLKNCNYFELFVGVFLPISSVGQHLNLVLEHSDATALWTLDHHNHRCHHYRRRFSHSEIYIKGEFFLFLFVLLLILKNGFYELSCLDRSSHDDILLDQLQLLGVMVHSRFTQTFSNYCFIDLLLFGRYLFLRA